MSTSMDKLAKELKNMMTASDDRKPKPYDTQAEVLRVENDIAWVHIPGGVEETPVRLTLNAKKGDMVNIHVASGSAWITGNGTNPPTDDTEALVAKGIAIIADDKSEEALADAGRAKAAADFAEAEAIRAKETADSVHGIAIQAQEDANVASKSATQALNGLSIVEDVVDTLTWLSEHAEFDISTDTYFVVNKQYYTADEDYFKTEDTQIVPSKTYYVRTGEGTEEHHYIYIEVQNPDVEDIDSYYEYGIVGYSYFPMTTDYSKTSDREVEIGKTYYVRSGEGTGDDPYVYTPVANPVQSDLDKYYEYNGSPVSLGLYELTDISEAVTNFIDTHLALTNQGLWISHGLADDEEDNDYKILIASGDNSGVYIYGPSGVISKYGTDIEFSSDFAQKIGGENSYIQFVPEIGNAPEHINIVADNVQIGARDATTAFNEAETRLNSTETMLANQSSLINQQQQTLNEITGYVDINTAEAYIRVGKKNAESYVQIDGSDTRVAINIAGKDVAYMSGDRFFAPSAVVTNLYMKTDLTNDSPIGAIGWVMRSNGHLSLKRIV